MHSTVGAIFFEHLDIVLFFYGLAFFAMGLALATFIRRKSRFKIARASWYLALFGLTHGLREWVDMFIIHKGANAALDLASFVLLFVSYVFLFEYGRRLLTLDLNAAPKLVAKFAQVNGVWVTAAAAAAALVPAALSADVLLTGNVLIRYSLGLPASLLCAFASVVYYRSERDILDSMRVRKYFIGAAAVFSCYAVFGGLIVPPAPFFPARVVNDSAFLLFFSAPVQIFRAACAFGMLWSSVGILKMFHWEQLRNTSLAESEVGLLKQQIEFVLGATKTGLDIIDSQYNLRYVDPAWQKIYGPYEGKKCYEYFMGKAELCPRCGVSAALRQKKVMVTEECLVREGGRPIQVTTIPFKNVDGEWMAAEVNVDITDRKRIEEALRASEEKYRLVFEAAADPIAVIDWSGTFLMMNRVSAQYLKSTPEECVGKTMWDLFTKPDADRQMASIRSVIESGTGRVFESRSTVADAERWFNTRIHPLHMHDRSRKCALMMARDITDHKRVEEAIKESEEKYRALVETTDTGFLILDRDGRVLDANAEYVRLTGRRQLGDIVGRSVLEWTAPGMKEKNEEAVKKCVRERQIRALEIDYIRPDGSIIPVEINATVRGEGASQQIVSLCRDITERSNAQKLIRDSEERYRTLMDNIATGVALISPQMEILALNKQMQGWFPDIDVGKQPICYKSFNVPPRDAPCSYCPTRLTLEDGKVHEAVTEASSSATSRSFRIVSTPLYDESGRIKAAIEMVEDITDRRQAERKLQWFRSLLDRSNDAIFIIELPEGRFLDCNDKACTSLGYSREELLARTVRDIEAIFPDEGTWARHVEEIRRAGYLLVDGQHRRKNGMVFPVDVNVKYIAQEGKEFMVAVVRDVTERKQAEAALRESERQYYELVEGANSVILKMDLQGRIMFWNNYAAQFFGYDHGEIIGRSVVGTIVPEVESSGRDLRAMIDRLCADPEKYKNNLNENMKRSGERVWVSWTNRPIVGGNGSALGVLCVGNDVTDRKRAEEALLKSEVRYHDLVDTAHAAIIQVDLDWNIQFWSKYSEEFFGYASAEVIGRSVLGTIVPQSDSSGRDMRQMIHDVFSSPDDFRINENENVKKNGERAWMSWSNHLLAGADKKPYGILCVGVDMTERKRAEEALQKAYAELQEMQNALIQTEKLAALGRFSLGVAHEVKNPLGIILGNIEYLELKLGTSDPDVQDTIKKMEQATMRADAIVHNLLRFARPTELKLEKVSPCALVDETVSLLKYRAPQSNIALTAEHERRDHHVLADRNQLQQVLFNLVMNAVEALPPSGGSVRLATRVETAPGAAGAHERCVIEISDTGGGISPANMKRLFEPFFTTKRDKKGTGLGLSVSKTIVENHKGEIRIDSVEGKGTTVTVTLPVA